VRAIEGIPRFIPAHLDSGDLLSRVRSPPKFIVCQSIQKALDYCLLPAVESATIGDLTVLAGRSLPSRRVRVCRRNEGMRVAIEPTELIGRTVVAEEECPDLTVRDD